ncbi:MULTISPECIES: DUF4097 family beta strand repeat-containing protein [Xanthomonas]|uniref:DUF4097 family beta strand repeat-containing protein n=1 Tax=Xanthomonas cucurbitae TaxID=56453 RepID=A0A2S7DY92_9XANT|nr:DUF4097 family beta strand repeat-containing protein [Xanthomonas cucurbitae]PPU78807.1 hypothetical protein XcuCFBP2542_01030 [Xanthomonas cucurbitae]QHG86699.1 hypothetical protein EBN15_06515 [Xanthomonas cucurbitae]WDM69032.1 DUF4097 family beta strand repeat-containing protein [Xanthomonas cucurbitae]WDM72903.1 DUF4097 family beta strand repeat-containing protein [Xanthomonas cucurbitae]WDM76613.1 DUF4097 family beta strand repeat-containing protein [Xanthomonas cucurbitae]
MRLPLTLSILLALPGAAAAEEQCKFSEPRSLELQLTGVKSVLFEVGSNDLHLDALPSSGGKLGGRACAARAELLKGLTVTQKRVGDKLVVTLNDDRRFSFGESYSYLDLRGSVPNTVLVQFDVGSGDAQIAGAAAVSADVGSGDMVIRRSKGRVTAKVGSGDVELEDIGALRVLSVGSGDLKARQIHGAAEIGKVGSGEVKLRGVAGNVKLGTIGSGDVEVHDVQGNVTVEAINSGALDIHNIRGDVSVARKGSGDVNVSDVTGTTRVPTGK